MKWTEDNIPDLSGKIVIVTGASSGIGIETARMFVKGNAKVIMAVRNPQKAEGVKQDILNIHPKAMIEIRTVDLSDLSSVQAFATAFIEQYSQLNILINNAGVMIPPYTQTKDGFELQFGTNHLGHFALTNHLLPLLLSTKGSRIVNVASLAHRFGNIDLNDHNWTTRKYSPWKAYGDSKLANLLFTNELQRRLNTHDSDCIATAAHPGWTSTNLQSHVGFIMFWNSLFAQKSPMGALPTVYAAISNDVQGGDYIGPGGLGELWGHPKKVSSTKRSMDVNLANDLWSRSEELCSIQSVLSIQS